MTFIQTSKHRVALKATPITDRLEAQKPPAGCSVEQWTTYVNTVRKNELAGVPNPEFGVVRPWTSVCSSRFISRVVGG